MNIGTSLKTISKNQLCSFVGTGGYVELAETDVLSDGSIVTAAAMLPLLNSRNDKGEGILPPGYQKVEFLESDGTQNIAVPTPDLIKTKEDRYDEEADRWEAETDCQFVTNKTSRIGFINRGGLQWGLYEKTSGIEGEDPVWKIGTLSGNKLLDIPSNDRHLIKWTTKYYDTLTDGTTRWNLTISAEGQNLTGTGGNGKTPAEWKYGLFGPAFEGTSYRASLRIWSCKCKIVSKIASENYVTSDVYDLIPVINVDGVPGMWDKLNKQFFENVLTGQFRVGIATLQQVRELQLPDNTGNAVRTLYVSLPQEARTDFAAQKNLSDLRLLNWSLNIQYRDGDIPADYTKVDFLAASGTQYIDTGILPANEIGVRLLAGNTNLPPRDGFPAGMNDGTLSTPETFYLSRCLDASENKYAYAGRWGSEFWWAKYPPSVVLGTFISELNWLNSREVRVDNNGIISSYSPLSQFNYVTEKTIYLFGINGNKDLGWGDRIYYCQISREADIIQDLVPVINENGVPGMWDKVGKQFYENLGTGDFIVGIKTLNDARMLNNALPTVTAESPDSIILSLPAEASTDAPAQKALKDLADRGWNITVQYRDDEIDPGYAKVAFLESSGEQNICVKAPELRYSQMLWSQEVDIQFLSDFKSLVGFKGRTGLFWGRFASKHVGINEDTQSPTPQIEREKLIFTTRCTTVELSYASHGEWQSTLAAADGSWKVQRYNLPGAGISQDQPFGLFRYGDDEGSTSYNPGSIRIWSCKCWCDSVNYDLIPVINTAGVPGMWDKVSKKFFENAGTGQFRVGLASKEAVCNLYLTPDVQEGTTINLSVPAGTTTEDTDALKDNNPNYTFNIQYRS